MFRSFIRAGTAGLALAFAALTIALAETLVFRVPMGVVQTVQAQVPNVACTPGQAITWDGERWSCLAVTGAAGATQWTGTTGAPIHYLFPVSIGTAASVPGASLTLGGVAHGVTPAGSDANSALATKGYVLGQISGLATSNFVDTQIAAAISGVTGGAQAWSAAGGNVFRGMGNVGIGINAPAVPLHVAGTNRLGILQDTAGTVDGPGYSAWLEFRDRNGAANFYLGDGDPARDVLALAAQRPGTAIAFSTNNTYRATIDPNGRFGLGLGAGPAARLLHLNGGTTADLLLTTAGSGSTATDGLRLEMTGTGANLTLQENLPLTLGANGQAFLTILGAPGDNRLGVNAPSPEATLHVVGSALIVRDDPAYLMLRTVGFAATDPRWRSWVSFRAQGDAVLGYVGDDTTASVNSIRLQATAANTDAVVSSSAGDVRLETGSTTRLHVTSAGAVGIGTGAPQTVLDVAGPIRVGTSAATCTSSIAGAQRYNATTNVMEYCNGASWLPFGTTGSIGAQVKICTNAATLNRTDPDCGAARDFAGGYATNGTLVNAVTTSGWRPLNCSKITGQGTTPSSPTVSSWLYFNAQTGFWDTCYGGACNYRCADGTLMIIKNP